MGDGSINRLQTGALAPSVTKQELLRQKATAGSFQQVLNNELSQNGMLKVSKHAQQRIQQRGIEISTELMTQLKGAVDMARAKGARDLVVIGRDNAFIVNVPNNTIVTTMAGSEMKNNIFTNIDSAVLL